MKWPRVEIEWRDIVAKGDWNEPPEDLESMPMNTLGYLVEVKAKEQELVLASTMQKQESTHDHSVYPLGCVARIIYLGEVSREEVVTTCTITGNNLSD